MTKPRKYKPRRIAPGARSHPRLRGSIVRLNITLDARVDQWLREAVRIHGPNISGFVEVAVVKSLRELEIIP